MSYETFSYYYDSLMDESFYDDYANFINNHIKEYHHVLELGCGSGELALRIANHCDEYIASDYSSSMLEVFSNKISLNSNIKLKNIDMIHFESISYFDLIICACDSINYILNKKDVFKVFKNVYQALLNDGYFIFDVDSLYKTDIILNNYHEYDDDDEFNFDWTCKLKSSGNIVHNIHIKDKVNDISVDEVHHQITYPINDYVEMLKNVGFKDISYYYDFDESYNKEAERIIFIVKK